MLINNIILNIKYNKDVLVNLDYNGTCFVNPPALITTYCQLNIENFPFDEKSCKLRFGRL